MMLGLTSFTTHYGAYLLAFAALVTIGLLVAVRTERGRYTRDATLLRLPIVGRIIGFAIVERFCRVLGSMVTAGVALPDAMAVANETTSNRLFQRRLQVVTNAMLQGEGLAGPLAKAGVFPRGASQMVRVGEATGTLDQQLTMAGRFYERELNYRLRKFTDLFEPAVIVGAGLIVGFVALALISAMYGIFNQLK
jgi:type IV pilus assembly protein PilC